MRRPKVSLLHGRCCNFAWFRMEPSLVPLGSMLHEVYYLQHFGLVPAWFHMVPAARSVVFTAHEVGSATKSIDFAWEGLKFCLVPPLVPLGSMLRKVHYLQHFGLVPAWFRVVPAAKTRKRGSINYQSRKNDPNPKLPKKLKNLKTIGNLPMVEARIFIM